MYLAGTGSTGVGMTLAALGLGYFGLMLASALAFRLPPANYADIILKKKQDDAKANPAATTAVAAQEAKPVKVYLNEENVNEENVPIIMRRGSASPSP